MLTHASRQPMPWLIFDVGQNMKHAVQLVFCVAAVACLSSGVGCVRRETAAEKKANEDVAAPQRRLIQEQDSKIAEDKAILDRAAKGYQAMPQKPNKAPEPTPTSVTPPAKESKTK